jgi:hypothetical protein
MFDTELLSKVLDNVDIFSALHKVKEAGGDLKAGDKSLK